MSSQARGSLSLVHGNAPAQAALNAHRSAVLAEIQRRPGFRPGAPRRRSLLQRLRGRLELVRERLADTWAVLRGRATAVYDGEG